MTFAPAGKLERIETLGESRNFVWSTSREFQSFHRPDIKFEGMDPMFVEYQSRSFARGKNSISKWPQGTDVAFKSSQLALIPLPIVFNCSELHHIRQRFEENNVRVLELELSPKFALIKQVVPNVKGSQSTMSSSSRNTDNWFSAATLFTWKVKRKQF